MFRNMCGQPMAQMLHVLSLEGITINDSDMSMLCSYMKGTVSGHDLLAHTCQFATLSSYQDWLNMTSRTDDGNLGSLATVEQIVAEVERFIRRKHLEFSQL